MKDIDTSCGWAERGRRRGRFVRHSIGMLVGGALVIVAAGCRMASKAVEAGSDTARGVIGAVDPTGIVPESQARKDAADKIREKVAEIDVQAFNDAVLEIQYTVSALRERIEALSPEELERMQAAISGASAALKEEIEAADFDGAVRAANDAGTKLHAKIEALDVASWNALIDRLNETATNLDALVQRLGDESTLVVRDARDVVHRVGEAVDTLPIVQAKAAVQQIESSAADAKGAVERWPTTVDRVEETLQAVRTGFRVMTVAGVLMGLCAMVWLVGAMRRNV